MAQVPAAAASTALSATATQALSFVVNLGASYLLSRLSAQDGPRLDNLAATTGEYGVTMPRLLGEKVRIAGLFMAQADIKESRHTAGSPELAIAMGAVSGAAEGFTLGGPVGAAIGAVAGGLLGALMPKQHYYTYSDTFALLLADRLDDWPIEGVEQLFAAGKTIFSGAEPVIAETFDANGRLVMRKWGQNLYFKSLALYAGGSEQGVDPVLAAVLSETGAYPFSAYIVIEDLQLKQFGNSVPTVEALTNVATGQSLASAVEKICAAARIDVTRDLSSTMLAGKLLRGYALTSDSTCWDALKPLLPLFGADAAEVSGQIRFYRREQAMRATIPPEDMGAHDGADDAPERYHFVRSTDIDLPRETTLTWLDPARDYQENSATAKRTEGNAASNVSIKVPVVLSADEGASAAALMHWDAWLGRTALTFTLTDAWLGLEAGLAYAIEFMGQFVPYRVTRRTRGANGLIEVEARSDEAVTYAAQIAHVTGLMPDQPSTLLPDTRLVLIDMPILEDAHDDYGFYIIVAGSAPEWERGQAQVSADGVNFATLFHGVASAIVGDVTGILAAGTTTGLDNTLDTASVLTVVLLHDGMTLASVSDGELDAHANFAFVGKHGQGEYVQFKTATKVAPKTWQLTNLRRGRRGTDWAIGLHAIGEEFALLGDVGEFRFVYSDDSDWGNSLTYRGVTLHQDEAAASTQTFINTGEGKRPYSPVGVAVSWDASNNATISWTPRSRLSGGGLGIDDLNDYQVQITNGVGRTLTATATTSVVYLAAAQTADGLTPGGTLIGRVRQLSGVNNGRWRDFVLTVGGATAAPLQVQSVAATPSASGNVLTWEANPSTDNLTDYLIYRADGAGASFGSATQIGAAAHDANTYTDTSAATGLVYTYFVEGRNAASTGSASTGVSVTSAQPSPMGELVAGAILTAAQIVNIFSSAGAAKVRPADIADDSKTADGFVLAGVASGAVATVYGRGATITGLAGLTAGATYWLAASGGITATVPASGWRQAVGKALSATALHFDPDQGTLL
jgi:hypothetical protein